MNRRLPGLDLLRGAAAAGVMWYHFSMRGAPLPRAFPVFQAGAIGVELFFVISGYVILMTAMRSRDRGAFARSRVRRLYPAYLACMILTTFCVLVFSGPFDPVSPRDWLLNLSMTPRYFGAQPVEGVYWTLAYEVAFYATVCACLPWIKRGGALWLCVVSLPLLWWQPLVAFFIVGVGIHEWSSAASSNGRTPDFDSGNPGSNPGAASTSSAGRASEPARTVGSRFRAWLLAMPPITPLVILAAVVLSRQPVVALAALALVAGTAKLRFDGPLARICTWAGAVSYPLYLVHLTIGRTALLLLAPHVGVPAALALSVAFVTALAAAVYHFVERPVAGALRRRLVPEYLALRGPH